MKFKTGMMSRMINLKSGILMMGIMTVSMMSAQNSNIGIRFASPSYDCDAGLYCLDVEYTSDNANDTLFGANLRFWYNDEVLTFNQLTNIHSEYIVSVNPTATPALPSSGAALFNFPSGEAAVWVNSGIQIQDAENAMPIGNGTWTAMQQVCFDVVGNPENLTNFCPEIIWDFQSDGTSGGFFPGNDGLFISLLENGNSIAADEDPEHLNWAYSGSGSAPYGDYTQSTGGCYSSPCINCKAHEDAPKIKIP